MKKFKPLLLKTYGKQRRKISAWISPENRKQVFDSTPSTDDTSVFEPRKSKRPRETSAMVSNRREVRLAKKKAMLCLAEKSCVEESLSDEENILPYPSQPQPAQQSGAVRGKRTRVCRSNLVRPAKRKSLLCLMESSSNEDNTMKPFSPPAQRRRTTKKTRLVSTTAFTRMRGQRVAVCETEEEEETSPLEEQKISAKMKAVSNVHVPTTSRFVTQRRRAAPAQLRKAIANILCSSDEFTSGAFPSSRIHQPSKRRRRVSPAYGLSSADSSAEVSGFMTNHFREISLNESANHILGPRPRKPIFCSTPSAGSFSKRGRAKIFPTHNEVTSPPSCVGALTTFQENSVSPQQPGSAGGLGSEERLQRAAGLHNNKEQSVHLFTYPRRVSCSGSETSEELPGTSGLSADSESSSHFVSAAGGLEWLMEALKEKCLNQRCTVQLQRLDPTTVPQLCSPTTYSSCLEHSSSIHSQETKNPVDGNQSIVFFHSSEESFHHQISVASIKCDYLHASVTDTTAATTESQSVVCIGLFHQTDQSCEAITSTRLTGRSRELKGFTGVEAKMLKENKWTVQLQTLSPSQITAQQLKGRSVGCCESADQETSQKLRCPGGSTGRERETRKSPVAKTNSAGPGETVVAPIILKEKCLTEEVNVRVRRTTLSQLKTILQPKASTGASDSACDEKTKPSRLSESDCDKTKTTLNVKNSSSSERKTSSGNEAENNSRIAVPKRKKVPPKENKRRSVSTDQSGTTRKACVSGMSTSRWKKGTDTLRSRTTLMGAAKTTDCSISELIAKKPPKLAGSTMSFYTPVRVNGLSMSSLLADLTPSTRTWSRLKAALSVHRKAMVQLTPRNISVSTPASARQTLLADVSRDLFATPLRTPLSRRLHSQLLSQSPLSADVCDDPDLSDAEKVYAECSQKHPLPWEECIPSDCIKRCTKIGEGTFGEVFSTSKASGETVALKVIPVEGSEMVNGENQKSFGEILHEIIISKELTSLKEKQQNQTRGFIGLNDLHCVQGSYPPEFLKAWDTFDQRKVSENDRPDFYKKDQLFIILEFEFGGVDLENSNGKLASLGVAKSILHQVTAALAVAEQELRFEHRDLHWGNVLVKSTKQKTGSFLLDGALHNVETKGVLVSIIDYSLSRLEIDDLTVSCDISNDEELFMGQGDYQFDIYRLMRQENGNNWGTYHPRTNVLWLHYLCSKLLSMKYRSTRRKSTKSTREELACFHDNVLQYSSATEVLQNCPVFQ